MFQVEKVIFAHTYNMARIKKSTKGIVSKARNVIKDISKMKYLKPKRNFAQREKMSYLIINVLYWVICNFFCEKITIEN